MSYDQWKTASPYDDEPDVVEECDRIASRCQEYLDAFDKLKIQEIKFLLEDCRDTLDAAARFIQDEI